MKQGIRQAMASLGLILAVSSCTDLPVVPKNTAGDPTPGATNNPGTGTPVQAAAVARLVVTPTTVEINAPYSLGGYQSETEAGPSAHEVAGYPTTAQLFVAYLAESGEGTEPAPLRWVTSNPELVMVDDHGWIRAVDPGVSGTASVTVQLRSNPDIQASTTVTVRNDGKLVVELK
ncbi:hypothetical protein D3C86_363400 [compost metagenome]